MPKPGRELLSRAWLRTKEKVPRIFLTFFPGPQQHGCTPCPHQRVTVSTPAASLSHRCFHPNVVTWTCPKEVRRRLLPGSNEAGATHKDLGGLWDGQSPPTAKHHDSSLTEVRAKLVLLPRVAGAGTKLPANALLVDTTQGKRG